jgi:DNA-binding response OmpR family regulator
MASRRIIVISSSEKLTRGVTSILRPKGYEVITESSASDDELIDEEVPDLVIVDLTSLGEPGQHLIAHLRTTLALAQTPIIVLSMHWRPWDKHVSATVLVPIEADDLTGTVRRLLNQPQPRAHLGAVGRPHHALGCAETRLTSLFVVGTAPWRC